MGQVINGDCLEILKSWSSNSIGLVYLDPPFFTQKTHSLKTRDLNEEFQFDDKWKTLDDYLDFLRQRLAVIHRIMTDHACIFFHCGRTASHHIRLLLDEIFGKEHFLSEIIWSYRRWSTKQNTLLPAHQTIFMYSKTNNYTFNLLMQGYSETTNLDQILQRRVRNASGKTTYARQKNGEVVLNGPKVGVPLSDVWEIPYLNPKAKERVGYPTQKPLLLLERIIKLASNPGDVVLDPFCGSGTTLVAAASLERDYVGIDISAKAIALTNLRKQRPVKSHSKLLANGRASYDNHPPEVKAILSSLPVKIVQRNSGIDAIHNTFVDGKPVAIRVQRTGESLLEAANKLVRAGLKKQAGTMVLIQTENADKNVLFEMMPKDVTVIKAACLSLEQALHVYLTPGGNRPDHTP